MWKNEQKKRITGIILAGGKSSRMGYDKGLAVIKGKKCIEWICETLAPITEDIIIISNNDTYAYLGFTIYEDIIKNKGPLGGIYTGLTYSATELNFIVACDMPFVCTELFTLLAEKLAAYEACIPSWKNQLQPLCACYRKCTRDRMKKLLRENILRMQDVLPYFYYREIPITKNLPFYSDTLLANINSSKELKQLLNSAPWS